MKIADLGRYRTEEDGGGRRRAEEGGGGRRRAEENEGGWRRTEEDGGGAGRIEHKTEYRIRSGKRRRRKGEEKVKKRCDFEDNSRLFLQTDNKAFKHDLNNNTTQQSMRDEHAATCTRDRISNQSTAHTSPGGAFQKGDNERALWARN